MSRSYSHHIQLIEEPSLTVLSETRALHHSRHELTIDEAREAYYRQTLDWQWQEEEARKADERVERAMKEGGV